MNEWMNIFHCSWPDELFCCCPSRERMIETKEKQKPKHNKKKREKKKEKKKDKKAASANHHVEDPCEKSVA